MQCPDVQIMSSTFRSLLSPLPADNVLEWMKMVEKWDENNEETNPFVIVTPSK